MNFFRANGVSSTNASAFHCPLNCSAWCRITLATAKSVVGTGLKLARPYPNNVLSSTLERSIVLSSAIANAFRNCASVITVISLVCVADKSMGILKKREGWAALFLPYGGEHPPLSVWRVSCRHSEVCTVYRYGATTWFHATSWYPEWTCSQLTWYETVYRLGKLRWPDTGPPVGSPMKRTRPCV